MSELLQVRDLRVTFGRHRRVAVDGISFDVHAGARVGLVGESGSGKSVTALAIMGLLPENAHVTGSVRFAGTELVGGTDAELSSLRGDEISMVFQEPMTALDPTMRVGRQVAEALLVHRRCPRHEARSRVVTMLDEVGLPDPARVARAFPHELSGGQRQRILVAMALINRPQLLICDEPTTALDVTVQARVLGLIGHELDALGAATLFISHDLAIVAQLCDEVLVMRDGVIVESGRASDVLATPTHPYTRGLLATARLDAVAPGERLPVVEDFWEDARD